MVEEKQEKMVRRRISMLGWMEEEDWTDSGLAQELGSTRVQVNRWKKGKHMPGRRVRTKLADLSGGRIDLDIRS